MARLTINIFTVIVVWFSLHAIRASSIHGEEPALKIKEDHHGPAALKTPGDDTDLPFAGNTTFLNNGSHNFSARFPDSSWSKTGNSSTDVTEMFPEIIEFPIGKNHSRQLRQSTICYFPPGLDTATISCKKYSEYISCTVLCAYGYTTDKGIKYDMKCLFEENKWSTGFKECEPFIDCTVTMVSGGHSKCVSLSVTTPTECFIYCSEYMDYEYIQETSYICNIDGTWDPPLPFCATAGSGWMLVDAPKVKMHNEYSAYE